MSNPSDNNLTRQKLQQLLSAVGSRADGHVEKSDATEYNFKEPRYFNDEQLKQLAGFAERFAVKIAEKFQSFFNAEFEVTAAEISQHFAGIFLGNEELGQNKRHLVFSNKQNSSCGIVTITYETATAWLTLLLGDSESYSDESSELSELEKSLLYDIVSIFIRSARATENYLDFQLAKELINGPVSLDMEPADELFNITFDIKKKESESCCKATIVIRCKMLDKGAGKTDEFENKLKGEEIKKTITEHLSRISVPVTVQLGSAELTFEDIMTLQVDDVVLTGLKIDQTAQMYLEGNKIFDGKLAKVNERKAFVVTSPVV